MNWQFWKEKHECNEPQYKQKYRHLCDEKCNYCCWATRKCVNCGLDFKFPGGIPCHDGYAYACSHCGKIQNVVEPDGVSDAWGRWFEAERKYKQW